MTRLFVATVVAAWGLMTGMQAVAATKPAVIPQPLAMTTRDGSFTLTRDTVISYTGADAEKIVSILATALAPATGFDLKVEAGWRADGVGLLFSTDGADPELGAEGYTLTVAPERVIICAPKAAGLFYGMQTLLQLLPPKIESPGHVEGKIWCVPCVEITDRPRFTWRGLTLDVSRHFFTKDEVKAYLDAMARYKFNSLQLHLTDDQGWRIEIKKHPKLTQVGAWRVPRVGDWGTYEPPHPGEKPTYGGFFSQDEIRELVTYAQERFITLLPEIDVPGHSMAALAAYPKLSCTGGPYTVNPGSEFYGKIDNAFCPGKDATFTFLDEVFTEVAALFPGAYIHMGGDEAFRGFWEACPDCKRRMQVEGLKNVEELQSYFVKRVEKILTSKGKRLIGWDEILEGGLAPNATVMSWRGVDGGIAAAKIGHQVIVTPWAYYYLDLYQGDPAIEPSTYGLARLNTTYGFEPLPDGVAPKLMLGIQGNLWTESVSTLRHAEYMTWPRAFAIAETAWSPKELKSWPDFARRVETHFQRFDASDRKYARSMYDAVLTPKHTADKKLAIELSTELPDLTIHYTFDGSDPDAHYPKYETPLKVPKNATMLRVVTCRNGRLIGRVISVSVAELEKRASK